MNSPNQNTATARSFYKARFLIVDDDQVVTSFFRAHLGCHFPKALVEVENRPWIAPGYDVYFVDNDFGGKRMATKLISEIREIEPQALVVALSATLELDTLRRLVNLGCNAVYSKRNPDLSSDAREVIANYLSVVERKHALGTRRSRFTSTVASLFDLLAEWNKRLDDNARNTQPHLN